MAVVEAQETRVLVAERQERALPVLRWIDASWFPWVWMGVWAVVHATDALVSWHFVVSGAELLRSPGHQAGLHLYATHPELQMGPLTFVVASPVSGAPEWASGLLAVVTIAAAGPLLLQWVTRLPQVTVTARQRGLAAIVLMPVWAELAVHYTHLDDALALALLVASLHAVSRGRAATAALLLAASADAKPWALAFVPVLLALPRDRWQRAAWSWLAGIGLAWLPFMIADPATLHVGGFSIPNVASSSLRPFGVTSPETPVWDRPAQVLLGVALGLVAVLALLAVVALGTAVRDLFARTANALGTIPVNVAAAPDAPAASGDGILAWGDGTTTPTQRPADGLLHEGAITMVSHNSATTYALDSSGKAYAWGYGGFGALGNGGTSDSPDTVAVAAGGSYTGSNMTYLTAGNNLFACGILSNRSVVCWGWGLSGQLGNRPGTLELVPGGMEAEARQTMDNIAAVLKENGLSFADVFKVTVMLADMSQWPAFNNVYVTYFDADRLPARSAFGCNGLALGAQLELECMAYVGRSR